MRPWSPSAGQGTVEAVALGVALLVSGTLALTFLARDSGPRDAARLALAAGEGAPAPVPLSISLDPTAAGLAGVVGSSGARGPAVVRVAEHVLAIGVVEVPPGSNDGPQVRVFTDGRAEEWCADFVSWVLRTAGRPLVGGEGGWRIAGTAALRDWFRARGRYVERAVAEPRPGDVVYFGRGEGHAGIVRRVSGATLETIEGNSGDAVSARTYVGWRSNADIGGFGRP